MIIPVILSGGSGTRLWPLSREQYPKQFAPLLSFQEESLLQLVVQRAAKLAQSAAPIIISNETHRFMLSEQLRQIGVNNASIILEPEAKNTAPAIYLAALHALQTDPAAYLLVLPADHLIADSDCFQRAVAAAEMAAAEGYLVTFGIKPSRPETGYGYIKVGSAESLEPSSASVYAVERFVEKPAHEQALTYLEAGDYYWNGGMFLFQATTLIQEFKQHAPAIAAVCERTFASRSVDPDYIRLKKEVFSECPSDSIDYALLEKSAKIAMVELETDWSDVGSWQSLAEVTPADHNNNVLVGDVLTEATQNCYIHSSHRLIAALGLSDHVIVETDDAILVADKKSTQDVKKIVAQLKLANRSEAKMHRKVYRPWGWYESLNLGENFQVKKISVNPGASLSLQMHHHRAEHWVVVSGVAKVTCGEKIFNLIQNQSTYIPKGTKHRLENPDARILKLIEIQSGDYLGEDDIVRFEDNYGREGLVEA